MDSQPVVSVEKYKDIERVLRTFKVEDNHIMLGEPIHIEKYGKIYEIKQVNWWFEWDKYCYQLGIFLTCFNNVCDTFKLPDTLGNIQDFRKAVRITLSNSVYGHLAFNALTKLLAIHKIQIKDIKKDFDIDDITELFAYSYLYNILGVKKNCSVAFHLIGQVR